MAELVQLRHQFAVDPLFIGRMPAVGDLDQDGTQEIIIANTCYNSDFTPRWTSSIQGNYGHWSAILNADEDLDGEVAMVGAGWLGIYDPDGTELFKTNAGTGQPGPPCVATLMVMRLQRSLGHRVVSLICLSWTVLYFGHKRLPMRLVWLDAQGTTSMVMVLMKSYSPMRTHFGFLMALLEGAIFSTGHLGTIFEYPIVADIDNDDSGRDRHF